MSLIRRCLIPTLLCIMGISWFLLYRGYANLTYSLHTKDRLRSTTKYRFQYISHDWINRPLHSHLAKEIARNLANCNAPAFSHSLYGQGMGADIHIWSQALCNAMERGGRLVLSDRPWVWNDDAFCTQLAGENRLPSTDPFFCYFTIRDNCRLQTASSTPAMAQAATASSARSISHSHNYSMCPSYITDESSRQLFRAAAVEYLFSNLRPEIVQEADGVIGEIFHSVLSTHSQDTTIRPPPALALSYVAGRASPAKRGARGHFPIADMISVHIRRGDKITEMDLVSDMDYIRGIDSFVQNYSISEPHIFLTTEDKRSADKFSSKVEAYNATWRVFTYDKSVGHMFASTTMYMAQSSHGALGRFSLISLLIALEAKYYVLTSGSNWSRLIDELRRNVLDVECQNCTRMLDLR